MKLLPDKRTFTVSVAAIAPIWSVPILSNQSKVLKNEESLGLNKLEAASEVTLFIAQYRDWVYPKYTHVEMYNAIVAASSILTEAWATPLRLTQVNVRIDSEKCDFRTYTRRSTEIAASAETTPVSEYPVGYVTGPLAMKETWLTK